MKSEPDTAPLSLHLLVFWQDMLLGGAHVDGVLVVSQALKSGPAQISVSGQKSLFRNNMIGGES